MKKRLPIPIFVALLGVCAQAATTSTIAWNSPTAASSETFILCGQFLVADTVKVGDGTTTADAEILQQDVEKIMAVVPASMSTGTLWVWIADGANSVTLNSPEYWWTQPDKINIGQTVRLFGRNFSRGSSPTLTVLLQNAASGTTYTYSAPLLDPFSAQLVVAPTDDNGTTIPQGSYDVYLDEPKLAGVHSDYGALHTPENSRLTLDNTFLTTIPQTVVLYADDYGAVPNDSTTDTAEIRAATVAASGKGGGVVKLSAGEYIVDEYTNPGQYVGMVVAPKVELRGAGIGLTTMTYRNSGFNLDAMPIVLGNNDSALTSMTVRILPGVHVPDTFIVSGLLLQNLKIVTDDTHSRLPLPVTLGSYTRMKDVSIYTATLGVNLSYLNNHLDGVHIYGPKLMSWYTDINTPGQFGSPFIWTAGSNKVIIENCSMTYREGPARRWFVAHSSVSCRGLYCARNQTFMRSTPYSNSAENFLIETSHLNLYHGQVTVDPTTATILHLDDVITTNRHTSYAPLIVAVTSGTGFAQLRTGIPANDGLTITMDRPFTVAPDANTTVSIGPGAHEFILYDNDFMSTTVWATAGHGIEFWGTVNNTVVSSCSFTGFHTGYATYLYNLESGVSMSINYDMEVEDCLSSGCLHGFMLPSDGATRQVRNFANIFRRNQARNILDLPPIGNALRYIGFGSSGHYLWNTAPNRSSFGMVYEDNTVDGALYGFRMDYENGDWHLIRRNHFDNITSSALYIDPAIEVLLLANTSNTLPQIQLTAASGSFRTNFNPVSWETIEGYEHDYFVWADNSGSMTLSIADADNDDVTVTLSGASTMPGAVLTTYPIEWTALPDGLHEINVNTYDGSGTSTKQIFLFAGDTLEQFSNIVSIDATPTSNVAWTIVTSLGTYVTSRTGSTGPSGYTYVWEMVPDKLYIRPINQEICLRPQTQNTTTSAKSVLSFLTQRYYPDGLGDIRARLLLEDGSYYEYYSYADKYNNHGSLHEKDNKLVKVSSDGTTVSGVYHNAGHVQESPVMIECNNGLVRGYGWGKTLEFVDPSPCPVVGWEISIMEMPGGTGLWESIDNLYFAQSGPVQPVMTLDPLTAVGTEAVVSWTTSSTSEDYLLEWSETSNFAVLKGTTGWTSNSAETVTGLTPFATYYYRTRGRSAEGDLSLWSDTVSAAQGGFSVAANQIVFSMLANSSGTATMSTGSFGFNGNVLRVDVTPTSVSGTFSLRVLKADGTTDLLQGQGLGIYAVESRYPALPPHKMLNNVLRKPITVYGFGFAENETVSVKVWHTGTFGERE